MLADVSMLTDSSGDTLAGVKKRKNAQSMFLPPERAAILSLLLSFTSQGAS